jgi:hypothetical protein
MTPLKRRELCGEARDGGRPNMTVKAATAAFDDPRPVGRGPEMTLLFSVQVYERVATQRNSSRKE